MARQQRSFLQASLAVLALNGAACGGHGATAAPAPNAPAEDPPLQNAEATDTSGGEAGAAASANSQAPKPNDFWWPDTVNLEALRQHEAHSNPYGDDFDYAAAFKSLDLEAVKKDVAEVLTTSQDWWPADHGNYGPLFIRMAWHSAGTYRMQDGRGGAAGGQQRFEPLNSWPDNGNLDKARRLLWPVKQKYGKNISWADLIVLAGTVAMDQMGFKTFGFAGGREDDWQPELVYWGPEKKMMARTRFHGDGDLHDPLASSTMGLIYVNPEGPGKPDPLEAAKFIRMTFGRMAMNDEETVALIAGGHTFGRAHGAVKKDCVGPEPAAEGVEQQGFGWKNKCGAGHGSDTFTSGLEGAWSVNPVAWTTQYLDNLFGYEWVQTTSPAGAVQWEPKNADEAKLVPDAQDPNRFTAPMMFTTDLSLKYDPEYRKIAKRFHENPKDFELAFAKAWFKLTHRDMGPSARYLGADVPDEELLWQDPVPEVKHKLVSSRDIASLKVQILKTGLSVADLVRTAWASASTYRDTDMRGGANGARIRLAPQKDWAVNEPEKLATALAALEKIQKDFNEGQGGNKRVSLADVIVIGGAAAIEKAAKDAGYKVSVPVKPGRGDTSQELTDVPSFAMLEPKADAFRNYYTAGARRSPVEEMVDRADLLALTVPEMAVLIGGLRVLGTNVQGTDHGVLTKQPGTLTNDFFVNLLDMSTAWAPTDIKHVYQGSDRQSGEPKWTASEVDLVFGSNAELRAVAEVYAFEEGKEKFVDDFVAAWTKVMRLDRFDLE